VPEAHHLRQFLLLVFALLLPCFALWTAIDAQLAQPAIGLVNLLLGSWFPAVVDGLYLDSAGAVLLTRFGEQGGVAVPLAQSEYQLGFRLNPGILSYSLPFYTALYFATQRERYFAGYATGLLVLYAVLTAGLVALCLKELMVNLGGVFLEQPGVFMPGPDAIGLCYQASVLLLPTLAPVALWAWQSRDTPLLRAVLAGTTPAP